MKKPLIALGALFFIMYGPLSCFHIDSPEYQPTEFIIDSLALTTVEVREGEFRLEILDTLANTDTTDTDLFALIIEIADFHFVETSPSSHNLFIPTVLADQISPFSVVNIALISITSPDTVFINGEEVPPGVSLTNYFSAQSYYGESKTVLKFIQEMNVWYRGDLIVLKIAAPLDQPLTKPLEVKVTMEDETVFELESPKVVIEPAD